MEIYLSLMELIRFNTWASFQYDAAIRVGEGESLFVFCGRGVYCSFTYSRSGVSNEGEIVNLIPPRQCFMKKSRKSAKS